MYISSLFDKRVDTKKEHSKRRRTPCIISENFFQQILMSLNEFSHFNKFIFLEEKSDLYQIELTFEFEKKSRVNHIVTKGLCDLGTTLISFQPKIIKEYQL